MNEFPPLSFLMQAMTGLRSRNAHSIFASVRSSSHAFSSQCLPQRLQRLWPPLVHSSLQNAPHIQIQSIQIRGARWLMDPLDFEALSLRVQVLSCPQYIGRWLYTSGKWLYSSGSLNTAIQETSIVTLLFILYRPIQRYTAIIKPIQYTAIQPMYSLYIQTALHTHIHSPSLCQSINQRTTAVAAFVKLGLEVSRCAIDRVQYASF